MKLSREFVQTVIEGLRLHSEELHMWEESDGSLGCAIKLKEPDPINVQSLKVELEKIGVGHVIIETHEEPRYGGSYH